AFDRVRDHQFRVAIHFRGVDMGHAEIKAMTQRRHRALAIAAIEIPGALPDHGNVAGMAEFFMVHDNPPYSSLRGAQRRSNPETRRKTGLLRYARNDASLMSATITVPVEDSVM